MKEMQITKESPVCPCGRQMPNFKGNGAGLTTNGARPEDFVVEAVTFHVRCICGASWDLKKWTLEGGIEPRHTNEDRPSQDRDPR